MPKDRIIQIDLNNLDNIKIWNSVSEAEHTLSISIYDAVNKFNRKSANCIWVYEKDFDKETYKHEIMINQNFVCQISLERQLIKIWNNAQMASLALNISEGNISMCCNGIRITCNNFYWCFYHDYIKDNYPIKKEKKDRSKKVMQFDYNGNLIKIWDSLSEASNILNIYISEISTSCKGNNSAGGYLWRLLKDYNENELIKFYNKKKTQVEKLDIDGNIICEYSSITEAAKDVGVKYPGICRAIKNNCKSGGYYWRKKEND